MTFRREWGACLSSTVRKSHITGLPIKQLKTLESSALNDGRSMLAMFHK